MSGPLPRDLLRRRKESYYRWFIRVGLCLKDRSLFTRLIEEDEKTRVKEFASDEDMYSDDEPVSPGPPPSEPPTVDCEDADNSFDAWLHRCSSKYAPKRDHDDYWAEFFRRS